MGLSNYSNLGYETNQVLSQNVKITFDTYKTRLGSMNTLVIGGTGTGKSRNIVRPIVYSLPSDPREFKKITDKNGNKIAAKHSFVLTDPKGELCRDTAGILEACGYKIKIFNLVDMTCSDCYNPFKYVNYNSNPEQALTILIDGLVDASQGGDKGGSKDPHWPNMAKAVLNSLAFYLFKEQKFEYQNFTQMSKLLPLFRLPENETKAPIDDLLNSCQNESLYTHPALEWRRKITAQGGELSSIISTAQAALRLWADSSVQRLTEVDTLDLDKIGDEPTAVYVITPTTNSTYDFLVATFYNQLFETLQYKANMIYHGELPHHVLVVQDEFANTGRIPDYDKKIATFRSCNISSIIIVQSPNQIKSMYENKAQDIIDNTHITIFLGNGGQSVGNDAASAADFISRALGKTTVKAESKSMSYQDNSGNDKLLITPNISTSVNVSQRDLMTPEEVRQLPADEEIVMITGYKPFRDKKIDLDNCLNYGSDLFTELKPNGQRKLKKQFDYSIETKKRTLNNYKFGKLDSLNIDNMQAKEWERSYIEKCKFSIIGKEHLCFVSKYRVLNNNKLNVFIRRNRSNIEYALNNYFNEVWCGLVSDDNYEKIYKVLDNIAIEKAVEASPQTNSDSVGFSSDEKYTNNLNINNINDQNNIDSQLDNEDNQSNNNCFSDVEKLKSLGFGSMSIQGKRGRKPKAKKDVTLNPSFVNESKSIENLTESTNVKDIEELKNENLGLESNFVVRYKTDNMNRNLLNIVSKLSEMAKAGGDELNAEDIDTYIRQIKELYGDNNS